MAMIISKHGIAMEVCPETAWDTDPACDPSNSSTPPQARSHFLALPTEIRLQIYHLYLVSLNLPERLFSHATMLGYWKDASGIAIRQEDYGFHVGRRFSRNLLSLLLLNQQIRLEVEEVLYSAFVFPQQPGLSSPQGVCDFYAKRGARLAPRLRKIQVNLAMNPSLWHTPAAVVFARWHSALRALVVALPRLKTVGLAVDYAPHAAGDAHSKEVMMALILSFVEIFAPVAKVTLRFVDVKYEYYGHLHPLSSPLCAEMLEEEKLLLTLRDDLKLIWHRVAMHFPCHRSELYSVTGLQARYERLKIRQQKAELEVEILKILNQKM